jgi:flagellar hook-associated protein 2
VTSINTTASGAPISFGGIGSGLNTGEIINALMGIERAPITRFGNQKTTLEGQSGVLQSIQSSLTQLTFEAQELGSPALFTTSQEVISSEPARVAAASSAGAAVGGYEVAVKQLANAGQRTFAFKSPAGAAETLTIDGKEFEIAEGATIASVVKQINADPAATVYAVAVGPETVVLSDRETGAKEGFIAVSSPGETLVEREGTAKEGRNAEYTIDEVAGTSATNKLTGAIPGVTLELKALTTTTGPVTVEVQPPAASPSKIAAQVQAFVALYNSTIGSVQRQLTTKPPASPQSPAELQSGTLFGDMELTGLLNHMRQSIYEPGKELPAGMASLADIGVNTGATTGKGTPSQTAVQGQLTLDAATLESAIAANPEGVEKMLQGWSKGFGELLTAAAGPGGTLEARTKGDAADVTELTHRIAAMNEMLAVRQKALESEFLAMEHVMSENQAQSSWLSQQVSSMLGASSGSLKPAGG